jgi:hypothetical protein
MAPGTATRVQVREATLSDFYARVIVNASGRVNLQDLLKAAPASAGAPAAPPEAATAAAAAPSAPAAVVAMGPITLVNGRVLFSDRFIRPNYSADMSELNGKLSEFSSQAPDGSVQLADLDLKGRAEGTAALEITGKINPLAKPLAMDIKGRVRDLDLPPLTAYSIKYAGYGIERGKLSMDVHYTVQPDGQLVATNNLVLNQLSFGDKVEGAPNSLPVRLAVALLSDRMAGRPGVVGSWPRREQPLSKDERVEFQERLERLGHAPGKADGIVGAGTRAAARRFQASVGEVPDGFVTKDLLAKLRQATGG